MCLVLFTCLFNMRKVVFLSFRFIKTDKIQGPIGCFILSHSLIKICLAIMSEKLSLI